jgi:hypothetical protein
MQLVMRMRKCSPNNVSNVLSHTHTARQGDKTQHGKFNNCHGITFDPRTQKIAVTDRGNSRIEFFDFDSAAGGKFEYDSTVTMANGTMDITQPCNFRVLENALNVSLEGMAAGKRAPANATLYARARSVSSAWDGVHCPGIANFVHLFYSLASPPSPPPPPQFMNFVFDFHVPLTSVPHLCYSCCARGARRHLGSEEQAGINGRCRWTHW